MGLFLFVPHDWLTKNKIEAYFVNFPVDSDLSSLESDDNENVPFDNLRNSYSKGNNIVKEQLSVNVDKFHNTSSTIQVSSNSDSSLTKQ